MIQEVLGYCNNKKIEYLFLDFFGTIVQRDCSPGEVKILWSIILSMKLDFTIEEEELLILRKKAEQAVISRAEEGEFSYQELCDEIYRRLLALDKSFSTKYNELDFYHVAHEAEIQAELRSQSYIEDTIHLINEAYQRRMHIIVISDFYLGQAELRTFLQKDELYQKIDNIFVSSDCNTSKNIGGLYKHVCKELNVTPSQCVMVGDNYRSDVQMAERYGIKAFALDSNDGGEQKKIVLGKIDKIAKQDVSGVLGYSNYCFLMYLYVERLYKSLIREGIQDIYFLSREGEFLKRLFDFYISKHATKQIHTHYLYVSRKATYPATLKQLDEENFSLLRNNPCLSMLDFFENIGMPDVIAKLGLNCTEIQKPIENFFHSQSFYELCNCKDFQELYEDSRLKYNSLFRKYCEQEGVKTDRRIAIADVGWNGTMQDNINRAIGGISCTGFYIGLLNTAYVSEQNNKRGLIFTENPQDSRDLKLWSFDHVFLERILWASHGATDHYEEREENIVSPMLKNYLSEFENYQLIKPIQDEIFRKFQKLDDIIGQSCYSAECLYAKFLDIHMRMLFIVNNQQLELQRKMIRGQMQNFGHLAVAGESIGTTFSKKRILKKVWNNFHLLKNTEMMFRILLNYDQKYAIQILYRLRYLMLKKRRM